MRLSLHRLHGYPRPGTLKEPQPGMLQAQDSEPLAEEVGRSQGCLQPWRRARRLRELDSRAQPLSPSLAEAVGAASAKVDSREARAACPPVRWERSSEEAPLEPDLCKLRNVLKWRLRRRLQRRPSSRRMLDCRTLGCTLGRPAARLRRSALELSGVA